MRRVMFTLMIGLSSLATIQAQDKKAEFLLDIRPGGFLLSPDMDGFTVRNGSSTYRENIDGIGSWTPTINAGIGINFELLSLDITAGPGFLWNQAFYGAFWQADLGAMFNLANGHFRIGPHVGIIGLGDATWEGDNNFSQDPQIDLQGNSGLKGGLAIQAGGKRAAFRANLDIVNVKYDVTTTGGWVAQDENGKRLTELDMSGVILELGAIFRF